jgi:hypothetical protein
MVSKKIFVKCTFSLSFLQKKHSENEGKKEKGFMFFPSVSAILFSIKRNSELPFAQEVVRKRFVRRERERERERERGEKREREEKE